MGERFTNPWGESNGYHWLGHCDPNGKRYDLYAIVRSDNEIDFGARFGNDGPEYASACAIKYQGVWTFECCSGPCAVAMARFFANVWK